MNEEQVKEVMAEVAEKAKAYTAAQKAEVAAAKGLEAAAADYAYIPTKSADSAIDGYVDAKIEAAFKAGALWDREGLIQWLSTESEFLFIECRKGRGDLAKQYRAELYKEIIAKLKDM